MHLRDAIVASIRTPPKVLQPGESYGRKLLDGSGFIRDTAPEGGLLVGGELLSVAWVRENLPALRALLKGRAK